MESMNNEYNKKITENPISENKLLLEELNDDEKSFVNKNIEIAKELLIELNILKQSEIINTHIIDKAIELWNNEHVNPFEQYNLNHELFKDMMACLYSYYLNQNLNMEWFVITDNYGTEIGLYHNTNNLTLFPFSLVEKAINNKYTDFISNITNESKNVIG